MRQYRNRNQTSRNLTHALKKRTGRMPCAYSLTHCSTECGFYVYFHQWSFQTLLCLKTSQLATTSNVWKQRTVPVQERSGRVFRSQEEVAWFWSDTNRHRCSLIWPEMSRFHLRAIRRTPPGNSRRNNWRTFNSVQLLHTTLGSFLLGPK